MSLPNFAISSAPKAVKLILGGIALALLAFALWWVFLRPVSLQSQTVQAKGAAATSEAVAGAAKEALEITVKTQDVIRQIDVRTERSSNEILNAPGAQDAISPGLHSAGVRALCVHDGRTNDPVCAELLHRDGGSVGPGEGHPPR